MCGCGRCCAKAEVIGLFYGDYFARPGKQGGAWMSSFRDQQKLEGEVLPLIVNNCNFVKSDPGAAVLRRRAHPVS